MHELVAVFLFVCIVLLFEFTVRTCLLFLFIPSPFLYFIQQFHIGYNSNVFCFVVSFVKYFSDLNKK